jgi:drug/metabolite transporter (DMT)-like permease
VNPVVAVFLGWLVLNEPITVQILVAATVILASVALIVSAAGAARDGSSGEDRRAKVEPELGFEG